MKIKLGSGSVSVNGVVYEGKGKVISILNNEVIIDGVVHGKAVALPEITVIVNGRVDSLHTELGNIIINGNAGMVKTASGDVSCENVSGNVESMSGNVNCKNVYGGVKTLSGNIYKE
ncbi:TPA: hypothetical protein ACHJ1B_002589 [Escherichia coli]|nr:hypothetical protein [Escherichia coli O38:H26]